MESNSIQQISSTYVNHNTAGRYKAILICPSGIQYMSQTPDDYNVSQLFCYNFFIQIKYSEENLEKPFISGF